MTEPALTIGVTGLNCASCVARLERALGALPEVTRAEVNLARETVTIEAEGLPPARLAVGGPVQRNQSQ